MDFSHINTALIIIVFLVQVVNNAKINKLETKVNTLQKLFEARLMRGER